MNELSKMVQLAKQLPVGSNYKFLECSNEDWVNLVRDDRIGNKVIPYLKSIGAVFRSKCLETGKYSFYFQRQKAGV